MFITSDRDGGQGGNDIWVSTRASTSAAWNPPVNLAGVNSNATDFTAALSPDGAILYFSSDREAELEVKTFTPPSASASTALRRLILTAMDARI